MTPSDRLGEAHKQVRIAKGDVEDYRAQCLLGAVETTLDAVIDLLAEDDAHRLAGAEPARQPPDAGRIEETLEGDR